MTRAISQYVPAANPAPHEERELLFRVLAEFHEMPGLTLTLPQAARLFSLESTRCERVLGDLVRTGKLATDGRVFRRANASMRVHQ
jgi:hypothetical protein